MLATQLRPLFLFCCSGTLALCLDFGVLYGLTLCLHLPHWLARCFSFLAAVTFTWQFNRLLTFKDRAARLSGFAGWAGYTGSALLAGAINYAAYLGVIALAGATDPQSLFLGVAAGSLSGLTANYLFCSVWFFKKTRTPDPCPPRMRTRHFRQTTRVLMPDDSDAPVLECSPEVSVVSPIYCEGSSVALFLDALEPVLVGYSHEIILVDDGSPDDSWAFLQREAEKRKNLRCLRLSRNFGKEAALAAGLDAARGDAVITLDSDLQHPPGLIPRMLEAWREDAADVIEARKEQRQKESALDKVLAILFYKALHWVGSTDLNGASDFKLLDRKVLEAWKELPECRLFYRGMTNWLGFRHMTLPFTPSEREQGETKWSFSKKFTLALDSMTAYTARPLGLIWIMGLFFFLFSLVMGGEALWMKMQGQAMDGFTTVILLILITGAAILSSICLLSVYLRQIFHEIKRRPRYLISEYSGHSSPARKARGSHVRPKS